MPTEGAAGIPPDSSNETGAISYLELEIGVVRRIL